MTRPPRPPDQADRDELERFKRDINLTEFAAARGYRIDRRESSQGSVVMRNETTDDKIIIARRKADQHWTYFSVRDQRDNGTIVDFVQRRGKSTLGEVRRELRAWSGSDRPRVRVDDYVPTLASPERDRAAVERLYNAAQPASNSPYLNSRGIRPETLSAPRFRDTFRIDARGNVLFPHHDSEGICGFESKNYEWTSFASGGAKALWMSQAKPTDSKLVLAESAIDALSHYQIRREPGSRYGSVAGQMSEEQLGLISRVIATMPPDTVVALAFDDDLAGDKLAAAVAAVAGGFKIERDRPEAKDWNDVLKKQERQYIESLRPAPRRGRDRGLS